MDGQNFINQVEVVGHNAGLFNLGNTCYMNSTVQHLHSVPELKSALIKYPHSGRRNDLDRSSHVLTCASRDLFRELDKNVKPVVPMQFWMALRKENILNLASCIMVFLCHGMLKNVEHNFCTLFLSHLDHLVLVKISIL